MIFLNTIKNGLSLAWDRTKNWVGKEINGWKTDPIGKIKGIGSGLASAVGKISELVGVAKKASDFVRNIPVIGDIASNTPGLSNAMNVIDTADKYRGTVNTAVQGGNNLIQRLPSGR